MQTNVQIDYLKSRLISCTRLVINSWQRQLPKETFEGHTMKFDNLCEATAIVPIREIGNPMAAGYISSFAELMCSDDSKYLNNFDESDLVEREAWLVPATVEADRDTVRVVGGFHFVIDDTRTARIMGATIDPAYRRNGMMQGLLAGTFKCLIELGAINAVDLAIRVLPDGALNLKAYRLFSSLGLEPTRFGLAKISGTRKDRHMYLTAEPDGKSYRYLMMRGEKAELTRASMVCRG